MIVYDITSMESFMNVSAWIELLYEHYDIGSKFNLVNEEAFILVGNKNDLNDSR